MSSGARVSIPNSTRKTIQNIKEVTGNHSDEEIYAMLKECSMDPNETVQKLLFQDPFHEVKRKRDRRKENLSNKEPAEPRWRLGMQGRGSRGGRENYSIRNSSSDYFDTSGNQSSAPSRNGINQISDKGVGLPTSPDQEITMKETGPAKSPLAAATKGPDGVAQSTDVLRCASISAASVVKQPEENKTVHKSKLGETPPFSQVNAKETPNTGEGESLGKLSTSSNSLNVDSRTPSPGGVLPGSVLVSTHNSRLPCDVDTVKGEVGSKQKPTERVSAVSSEEMPTADPEVESPSSHEEMLSRSVGAGSRQLLDSIQSLSSTHSVTGPSANSSNQSTPQVAGPQKVCISKEWKPESENYSLAQGSGIGGSSEIAAALETKSSSDPLLDLDSREATFTLQRKVEKLQTSDDQHVIIPNHLHVPEAEKIGFCFGSFDVDFDLSTLGKSGPENEGTQIAPSEIIEDVEETAEQFASNHEEPTTTTEEDYPEESQSPRNVTQDVPLVEEVALSTAVPEYSESKPELALPPGSHQQSPFQTSTGYSYGFVPAMMGSQLAPFDTSETQGGNTLVFPTTGPAHLGSQAAGIMQNSMFVTQQPPTVLRQPTAMPLPHYAPNYIPYGHYFSPLYTPTSPIHQYISNGVFSQQHQPGTLYSAPPGPAPKYSLPQYKGGIHPAAGNMTASEDLAASQFKESSIYITGQSEGLPIWIPAPGRDISALQASSLYNIPSQSQVTFAPTQIGHGTFAGIYHHPAQAVSAANIYPHLQQSQPLAAAVDLVRPAAIVYQQPQNAQINWPGNY